GIMGLRIQQIPTASKDAGDVASRDPIRILAPPSRRTSAVAQRHDLWPVERTPQAVGHGSWHGPDRGVPARLARTAWAPIVGTRRTGTGFRCESRVQLPDHPAADRDAVG